MIDDRFLDANLYNHHELNQFVILLKMINVRLLAQVFVLNTEKQ
jgi:hypothetical protein